MNEVCPACGDYVKALIEVTGWCRSCSGNICPCGKVAIAGRPLCSSCRLSKWEIFNQTRIAFYVNEGYSLTVAKEKVRAENLVKCAECGEPIQGGKSTSVVCRSNIHCRKIYRKITNIRSKTGLTLKEAYERINTNSVGTDR